MKANEAPEKIYLEREKEIDRIHHLWGRTPVVSSLYEHIEYTRTDVFIEKAYSWLKNHYRDYMHNPTGERLEAFFGGDMCNDFEEYMKGE